MVVCDCKSKVTEKVLSYEDILEHEGVYRMLSGPSFNLSVRFIVIHSLSKKTVLYYNPLSGALEPATDCWILSGTFAKTNEQVCFSLKSN